jgi:apolipoprotein N-acyltransferase
MKWLQDALTGKDNLTYDAARIVGVIGAAAYVAFWSAAVFDLGHFNAVDAAAYGAGLATVLLSMSGAVKLKESVEPEGPRTGG